MKLLDLQLRVLLPLQLVYIIFPIVHASEKRSIHLTMPDVTPTHDDSYLCVSRRMNSSASEFIVAFEPNASAKKVHHILIYGCSHPGKFERDTPDYVWECGEMNQGEKANSIPSTFESGPVCGSGALTTILFGWALDAPALEMPPQVGFKIGGDSGIDFLVLQVHYGHTAVFRENPTLVDNSGIILDTVWGEDCGITKMAGVYLLLSNGYVPKGVSKHTIDCMMNEDKVIHPFRFRTHTHKLGTKVGGYKLPASNPSQSILIGEHNPQEPQMFYPIEDSSMTISRGDKLHAYCDFNNTRDHTVYIGATDDDEMCNFYMMYWTEGRLLDKDMCFAYNPK